MDPCMIRGISLWICRKYLIHWIVLSTWICTSILVWLSITSSWERWSFPPKKESDVAVVRVTPKGSNCFFYCKSPLSAITSSPLLQSSLLRMAHLLTISSSRCRTIIKLTIRACVFKLVCFRVCVFKTLWHCFNCCL